MNEPLPGASHEQIGTLIRLVRNHRVILDSDLSKLYEVPTKRLNEQFRRNLDRFPEDFAFELTQDEWTALRSQIATLKAGRGSHRKYLPIAFTEFGALMAANVLNSPRAVALSVYVIRAFVKMREDLATNAVILKRLAEIDKTLLLHDQALREIVQKLRPLLAPPPQPSKPEIGFHVKEEAVPYRVRRKSPRSSIISAMN
ncbi:MAG: ORF6N domain-containing protein [Verrucomicrobia bacterium]|nr:ORF6N domain-containing protein [Verrucomicrobiota bacterium]